jgi:hypothetical protein
MSVMAGLNRLSAGSKARVHEHLESVRARSTRHARRSGFDGIMTSCVFAWEERAIDSSCVMRNEMQRYVDKYLGRSQKEKGAAARRLWLVAMRSD